MRSWMLAAVAAAGCATGPGPELPRPGACGEGGPPRLEVAPPDGDYGDLVDGASLWCGNPPQGGAPYTPFRLRIAGPDALGDGVWVEMSAVDTADGTELAYTELTMGLTCANVGDNAGSWVGSEAHMRYFGFALEDLPGREAEVTIAVRTLAAEPLELAEAWTVHLVGD